MPELRSIVTITIKFILKFIEQLYPLSRTWDGMVSFIIFGAATTNTPDAKPYKNLPKHKIFVLATRDNKDPKIATKLNKITIFFLPFAIILPPNIEPRAIPATEHELTRVL